MKSILTLFLVLLLIASCKEKDSKVEFTISTETEFSINESAFEEIASEFKDISEDDSKRLERGLDQLASIWNEEDGTEEEFIEFCKNNFLQSGVELDSMFAKVQRNWETMSGHFNKMLLDIKRPVALTWGEITPIDRKFDSYDPSAHLEEDLFKNKIGFTVALNFPFYSLEEKIENADKWSRKEWAYVRMGDIFTSRAPSELIQNFSKVNSEADAYIYEYYIHMGNIIDENGEHPFPEDLKLISHWNLRDELKSQYANTDGKKKQELIYAIMQRIVTQEIPEKFINSNEYDWDPVNNILYKDGKKEEFESEPNTRYQKILNQYSALKKIDEYSPELPTYIERKFSGEMELTQQQVEKMFTEFVSSPVVKDVAELIKKRLGRDLRPYDIWYDGFKSRSSISEKDLDIITKNRYPTPGAVKKDLPNILKKFGWDKERAEYISSLVGVDPSRGAGHAWGAEMKGTKARLRTRINDDGMDYKGYNIAVHEFGHNVEQVISLHDVDYYMLNGVPNTAFTEGLAFVFQLRDLELLGIKDKNKLSEFLYVLDTFWSTYEIMGVSLVDQETWKWLYENPEATKEELNEAINRISKEVWNKYYAPVFGVKDSNILGIYSHMISYPLYLSAYPIGHLIEFQVNEYVKGKNLGEEFDRMARIGRVTPNKWMREAVGSDLSPQPLINQTKKALGELRE